MYSKITFTLSLLLIAGFSFGQVIDSLKLNDNEIPAGYSKTDKLQCTTPHASSVYDQSDLFEVFLGKVTKKAFQSFNKKGDSGSILYFEFEKEFKGQRFLDGLLWESETKATKSEPDEYYAKGNVLIIWSFNLNSTLKQISMTKVKQVLN